MEEWQAKQIIDLARQCHVVDVQGKVGLDIGVLWPAIRQIRDNRGRDALELYRLYIHPETLIEYLDTHRGIRPGQEIVVHDVRFRPYDWMPGGTALLMKPGHLMTWPLIEMPGKFAKFVDANQVWLIINLLTEYKG